MIRTPVFYIIKYILSHVPCQTEISDLAEKYIAYLYTDFIIYLAFPLSREDNDVILKVR